MALWLFCYLLGLSSSVLVGGLTLALLILPIIIVATREALRSIPNSIREAAYASGATKWQTIRLSHAAVFAGRHRDGNDHRHVAGHRRNGAAHRDWSRGMDQHLPRRPLRPSFRFSALAGSIRDFTVLPVQMYIWTADPDDAFRPTLPPRGLVLIALTLAMNATAIIVRYRVRKKIKW